MKNFFFIPNFFILLLYSQLAIAQNVSLDEDTFTEIEEFSKQIESQFDISTDTSSLKDTDKIQIKTLVLSINNKIFINPKVGDKNGKERPSLIMRYLSFRKGDVTSLKKLKRQIQFSIERLKVPYFFSDGKTKIYFLLAEKEESDIYIPVNVYVVVGNFFGYGFGGGIISAYVGLYDITGLMTEYYIGINQQEVRANFFGMSPYPKGSEFKKFLFDIRTRALHYWVWSDLYPNEVHFDSLIYGSDVSLDYVLHPSFVYRQSLGVFGHTTVDKKDVDNTFITSTGSPSLGDTSFVNFIGNSFLYNVKFKDEGFYANYLEAELGHIFGFANNTIGGKITNFDMFIFQADAQIALQTGPIAQALHVQAGLVMPSYKAQYRPYLARANLRDNFFRTTALRVRMFHRGFGSVPDEVAINNYGYVTSLEYRLGFLKTKFVGFETYFFYDVGSAAQTVNTLLKNTRHAIGPGINFHFFSPIDLMAKFNFAFGDRFLLYNDLQDFNFSFQVVARR